MAISAAHMPRLSGLAAVFLICAGCSSGSAVKLHDTGLAPRLNYLDESVIKALAYDFPPPPAADSPEERRETLVLLEWQAGRTSEQCAQANAQEEVSFGEMFQAEADPFVAPLPREVSAFFERTAQDLKRGTSRLKKRWKRRRPHAPELKPCIDEIGSKYSYPSRHAASSRLFALILSGLQPGGKSAFLAAADLAARYRVLGGVHYPSDIEAGKEYAARFYQELLKKENFRRDMQSLRKYLKNP